MASRNTPITSKADKAAPFGDKLADRVTATRESITETARTANKTVDDARSMAADRLDSAASAVEDHVGELPGGQRVRDLASAAVDRLSSTADYVRSHDAQRMMADVEAVVKNNPGPALLIAAAFGFVVGRALTRD